MIKIILLILIFSTSCDDPVIDGCTSPSACNFNPKATKSDGTCIQPAGCNDWCPEMDGEPAIEDCAGECNGQSDYDECGICGGDDSSCLDCEGTPNGTFEPDCNGECGGTAIVDDCGVCAGGTTPNNPNYLKDCNGDCFGNALIDDCNTCTGGNTSFTPNFLKDQCGICNGDGYRQDCLNGNCNQMDCLGVCNKDQGYSVENECENQCENCGWQPISGCNNCEELGECILYGAVLDTCQICSDGASNHIADSDKDCMGICSGNAIEDCFGQCDGDAVFDQCGICNGQGSIYECGCSDIEEGQCDCNGNIDNECGICGAEPLSEFEDCDGNCTATGPNLDENGNDCANECGGNAEEDECGLCNGDGSFANCFGTEDCTNMNCNGICIGEPGFTVGFDCNGVCGGSASYDICTIGEDEQICCGGETDVDCGYQDECSVCDNNTSNDCLQDCNSDWGGTASIDNCGTCSGGNTGIAPNQGATDDGYSCSDINLLVDAGVCTDSDDCIANSSCPILIWSNGETKELEGFNFAACNINEVPLYVIDFNINSLNLSYNEFTDFPDNISNMSSLTTVNLTNNYIGQNLVQVSINICTLAANPCTIDLGENFFLNDCNMIPDCNDSNYIITDLDCD